MGGPGSGRQKSSGSGDAFVRVVTVLDGAEEVSAGFDDMSDSAREYQYTLADGNRESISFAEGNYVVADSVEDLKNKQKGTNVEMAASIIIIQGATSALNQMTGGVYKTIGGLEAMGLLNEEDARQLQEKARIVEFFTGVLEIILSVYTLYIAYGAYVSATTTGITAAKTAETSSVMANTVAWLANPMFWAAAAMVGSLLLLIYVFKELNDRLNIIGGTIDYVGDKFSRLGEIIDNFSLRELLTDFENFVEGIEDVLHLDGDS